MNVLLVEDEPRVADFIDRGLRAENHGVTVASSGTEGVDLAKTGEFDVIVLDLMLPDMHGYDVCQRLRLEGHHTPILMLTAMDAVEDKINGLKVGADDYLTKPFEVRELLARVRSLQRRLPPRQEKPAKKRQMLEFGPLALDMDGRRVFGPEGVEIEVSSMDFDLLETFARHPRQILSRDRLCELAFGRTLAPADRSLDIRIARLRKKIETDPARAPVLKTVRGEGYVFEPAG